MQRKGTRRQVAAAGLMVAEIGLSALPDVGLLAVLFGLFATCGMAIAAAGTVINGLVVARRAGWKSARDELVVAVSLVAAAVLCIPASSVLAPYLQLLIERRSLIDQIQKLSDASAPRLAAIQTDSAFLMASGIALDESDEIALPFERRSPRWHQRAGETPLGDGCWGITHLVGHYYRYGGDGICLRPSSPR